MHNPAAAAAAAAAAIMHDPSSAVAAYSPYHPHHHPHHHSHHHPHPHHHAHQQHAYYRVAGAASPATVSGIKEFGGGLNQIPTPDGPTPGSTGTVSHLHGGHHPNTLTSPHGLSSQHHHPASTIASTTADNLGIDPSHAHSHHSHQPQPQQQQQHHQPNVHHPNHPGHHHHHHNHHPSLSSSPVSTATAAQAAAVQTRILEMRKEKSRDAARSRRGKENHEFYELAKMLPLPSAITSQLDKASIIRLTISYLKLREFSQNGDPSWNSALSSMSALKSKANSVFENHQGTHILQSLDGFAFALGQDGRFLYISETVSIYLGLSQVEMTGSSIFDYTHQQDHAELAEQLGLSHAAANNSSIPHHHHQHHHHAHLHHQHSNSPLPPASVSSSASNDDSDNGNHYSNGHSLMTSTGVNDTFERQFCIRMKSTLTKRGCQHYKSSGYRVVNIVAHLRAEMLRRNNNSGQINGGTDPSKIIGLVALAIALPPPSINELRLEPDMFVTRHSLDFKIIHCEQRVTDLLNYSPDELIGRNFYSLIHGQDVCLMKKCHIDLINKGQSMSGYYRIVNKSGGYTWMQTCATLICNNPTASGGGQSKASNNVNSNGGASTPTNLAGSSTPVGTPVPPPTSQEDQDQSVICVNYVLSAIEYTGVIMDVCQIGHSNTKLLNTGHGSTAKIRSSSVHVKKSHSSTPSPEILGGSKMNNNNSSNNNSSLRSIANSNHNSSNVDMTATGQRPVPGPNETQSHLPTSHRHSPRLLSLPQPPPSSSSSRSTSSPMETRSENVKRRRMNSSPVRPWKSPSPPPPPNNNSIGPNSESNAGTHGTASSPNLLRHISVIRETPPILKPQAMAPSPYHAHHYHHLVDQYAAAYHLYKTGPNGGPISPQNSTNSIANPNVSPHHPTPHHWSAYG